MKETKTVRKEALGARRDGDMVEELILAYRPLVYALARQLQPADPKDEDLLQCGLIGLWRAAELWDGARPFGPLARHCARSEMVDHMRRERRPKGIISLDRAGDSLSYEQDWSELELRDGAERACPPGSRSRAAVLALADGVSLTQTAKALGVRRGRARSLARNAYRKIDSEDS